MAFTNLIASKVERKAQEFTSSGTWTNPGADVVDLLLVGGGAPGVTSDGAVGGRGGGAGAIVEYKNIPVSGNLTVTIGGSGGDTTVGTYKALGNTGQFALPGTGVTGTTNGAFGCGGNGGSNANGTSGGISCLGAYTGGAGGALSNPYGGGGGGAGGYNGSGGAGGNAVVNGSNGIGYGSGGGGAGGLAATPGAGGPGYALISWLE